MGKEKYHVICVLRYSDLYIFITIITPFVMYVKQNKLLKGSKNCYSIRDKDTYDQYINLKCNYLLYVNVSFSILYYSIKTVKINLIKFKIFYNFNKYIIVLMTGGVL